MHPGMRYVADKSEYIKLIDYINRNVFRDYQVAEEFFGFQLEYDEETDRYTQTILEYNGDIRLCPKSFPVVVSYWFDKVKDRVGDSKIQYWDWATVEELGIKIAEYNPPVVKQCKWKGEVLAQYGYNKCKLNCDGYCKECEDYWAEGLYMGYTEEEWAKYCEYNRKRDETGV